MRQYINKLASEGKTASTIEAAFEEEATAPADDEVSLLSYEDEDALGEELDTFDVMEGSAQSIGSIERGSSRSGSMKVVDLESSQALPEEFAEKNERVLGRREHTLSVSPVVDPTSDPAQQQPKSSPQSKGFSMLSALTTSPSSPLVTVKPQAQLPSVAAGAKPAARRDGAKSLPEDSKGAKGTSSAQALSDRISGWRDALPSPTATMASSKHHKTVDRDVLESSYDSDTMPEDLALSVDSRGAKAEQYMGPGELIDAKNETLMGLQRQKAWSFAKNAQLQREVDVLQQQLQQIEALERSMDLPQIQQGKGTAQFMPARGGTLGGPNASGGIVNNGGVVGRNWAAEAPPRRVGGPRVVEANTNTVRRGPRDRDIAGGNERVLPSNNSGSTFGANGMDDNAASPGLRSGQALSIGLGGAGPRRGPRRRPVASNDAPNDSDDSAPGGSQQHSTHRSSRAEAWRTENTNVNNNSSSAIGTSNGRNRSDSDNEIGGYLQHTSIKKASLSQANNNNTSAHVEEPEEIAVPRRHIPRQRPRQEPSVQVSPSHPEQLIQSSKNSGSKALRGARRLTDEPVSEQTSYQPSQGAQRAIASASELPTIRNTNANSADLLQAMQSDQDDNSIDDQQEMRRRQGKNVLKNANRRRRHTMDEMAAAGSSSAATLQNLPESSSAMAADHPIKASLDIEHQLSAPPQGSAAGARIGNTNRPRIRQPPTGLLDGLSAASVPSASLDYSEESEREESKGNAPSVPRTQKPGRVPAGRRSSAENAQQLKEQKLKAQRAEKALQREDRRRVEKERQAAQEMEEEAFFTGSNPWTRALDNGWTEVELLLQRPIEREEDLLYAVAAAEAGMMFTDQLNSTAKTLGVLRGALSRWLLPYDSSTRLDEQASTPHSVIDNMPDEFRGKLTERQIHYLVAGANSVRKLVRIKIADDNDLEQARQALKTAIAFFKQLQEAAQQSNITPFALLEQRIR